MISDPSTCQAVDFPKCRLRTSSHFQLIYDLHLGNGGEIAVLRVHKVQGTLSDYFTERSVRDTRAVTEWLNSMMTLADSVTLLSERRYTLYS